MKLLPFCFFFCAFFSFFCEAQQPIQQLINAEKGFAKAAVETNTRAAFIRNLDSASVVFDRGTPVNGMSRWSSFPEVDSSLLLWGPQFAVIAASGDFGITLGPSEFRPNRNEGTQGFYGHFASVWHKNKAGEWKVLCDMGVRHPEKKVEIPANSASKILLKPAAANDTAAVNAEETKLIAALNNKTSISPFAAKQLWLLTSSVQKEIGVNETVPIQVGSSMQTLGRFVSPSNDMIVSYGKHVLSDRTANYLFVWVRETNTWKLQLLAVN